MLSRRSISETLVAAATVSLWVMKFKGFVVYIGVEGQLLGWFHVHDIVGWIDWCLIVFSRSGFHCLFFCGS